MQGFKNLFTSKKATFSMLVGIVIGGLMQQGLITVTLGAELLAALGIGYGVSQGVAEFGTGGNSGKSDAQ